MSLVLSSAALSLLAVVGVWLAGRRDPACSPFLTLGSLLTLLLLPLLAFLPKLTIEVPSLGEAGHPAGQMTTMSWLTLAWTVGFACFALRLASDFAALRRWRLLSREHEDPHVDAVLEECVRQLNLKRPVTVRLHEGCASPIIAGLARPVVYLPLCSRNWCDTTLRMVLLHELGHVARRDLWVALTAHLACLVHWFNPLVWWLRRRLLAQCEFACDAKVIAMGADPAHYATALCDVAEAGVNSRLPMPHAALAMATRATLRQRVERVIGHPGSKGSLVVTTTLLLTVTASLALSVVRFAPPHLADRDPLLPSPYTPHEIEMRLSANPFPAD